VIVDLSFGDSGGGAGAAWPSGSWSGVGTVGSSLAAKERRAEQSEEMADGGGEAPLVGVIMGSDSDLPCMAAACEKLKQFGVSEPAETFKLVRGRKQRP
jgi:hypothetical protein